MFVVRGQGQAVGGRGDVSRRRDARAAELGTPYRVADVGLSESRDVHYVVKGDSLCRHASGRHAIGEPGADPLSEADLSSIWAGQSFPAGALQMADGQTLTVLNPGRPNFGAGPDFRDAVLELDGELRLGDVELHVRASFFRGHGHDRDHAYDRVALHVVYLADEGPITLLANGRQAPVASFAPWLLNRRAEIETWLSSPALWQDPCRDAAARLGEDGVTEVLRQAGQRRFAARAAQLTAAAASVGEEQALWAALLDSLGVGGDRQGFRRLAALFPASLARQVFEAGSGDAALLAGSLLAVAGLGGAPEEVAGLLPPALAFAIARTGRPLNWPERRLTALAHLYARAGGGLAAYAAESVSRARTARELLAAWQVAGIGAGPALLGGERAQELLVNVLLPFAAGKDGLAEPAEAFMALLPAAGAYGRSAFLESNLVRAEGKRRVSRALEQQGLLAMVSEWCRQGGCGRCPLS